MSVVKSKYRGTKAYGLVFTELITAAKYRGTFTYKEIAKILGITQPGSHMANQVGQILGEISEDELVQGRPMLSAIAVGVEGKPGSGFFGLAKDLGRLKDGDDEQAFWEKQRQAVYDYWKVEL